MKVSELVTNEQRKREIEARARADAANGVYAEPEIAGGTYADQLFAGAENHIYALAHGKRAARLCRMQEKQ